jgi:hypothetical protein
VTIKWCRASNPATAIGCESLRPWQQNRQTAKQVASDFFFNQDPVPLPNRRIKPYTRNLDEAGLNELFTKASDFRDGLADRIAAHLMVEGPFNVNSTSVEAWKALLSSLKGKPVAYPDKDKALNGVINPDAFTVAVASIAARRPRAR